ncbi:MAG TPA: nucleotidyltransferase family protein [Phycisphaerae bacterium]|nr:nucleotidyltransferase family protein [Phycisphaerae bacterium]
MSAHRVFAVIPAAGRSSRMGRPKQLMPYGEGSMLDAVMDAVLESPIDGLVLVVNREVGARYEENAEEGLFISHNDNPTSEMIDSIKIGLARLMAEFSLTSDDGVMILPADQPQIRAGIVTTCAEAFRTRRQPPGILIATYGGHRGHPSIFRVDILREIESWPAHHGLNQLARLHPEAVREVRITTGPMPIDVNTPEDYERVRASTRLAQPRQGQGERE